jgi:hypothetical protein
MPRPTLLPLLAAALLAAPSTPAAAATPREEVRALRVEIAALQLDRALNLTPAQARALLPVLQDAAGRARALRDQREAAAPGLAAVLTRARDELRATGSVSDATRLALAEARGPRRHLREQLQDFRARVRAILSPEQLRALAAAPSWTGPGPGSGPAGAMPGGPPVGQGKGGRGPQRRWVVARVLVSDPFLVLVQARAG